MELLLIILQLIVDLAVCLYLIIKAAGLFIKWIEKIQEEKELWKE